MAGVDRRDSEVLVTSPEGAQPVCGGAESGLGSSGRSPSERRSVSFFRSDFKDVATLGMS